MDEVFLPYGVEKWGASGGRSFFVLGQERNLGLLKAFYGVYLYAGMSSCKPGSSSSAGSDSTRKKTLCP